MTLSEIDDMILICIINMNIKGNVNSKLKLNALKKMILNTSKNNIPIGYSFENIRIRSNNKGLIIKIDIGFIDYVEYKFTYTKDKIEEYTKLLRFK